MFQSVIALKPDLVQDSLKCVACMELSVDPVIVAATCEHIFCRECVEQAFGSCEDDTKCPACRKTLSEPSEKTKELKGVTRRVWGEIEVRCAGHGTCKWTGAVLDALPHVSRCQAAEVLQLRDEKQSLKRKVEELKTSNVHLATQEEDSRAKIESLETAYESARASTESLQSHCDRLKAEARALKSKVAYLTGRLQWHKSHKKPRMAADPDGQKREGSDDKEESKKSVQHGDGKNTTECENGKNNEKSDDENYCVIVEEAEMTPGQNPAKDRKSEETPDRVPVGEPDKISVETRGTATNAVDGIYCRADGDRRNGAPVYVMERRGIRVMKFSVFALEPATEGCSRGRTWCISARIDGVENFIMRCESSNAGSTLTPETGWQNADVRSASNAGAHALTISYIFNEK